MISFMTNGDLNLLMTYLGLTDAALAKYLGVSRQSVCAWRSGKTPIPAWSRIVMAYLIRDKAGIDLRIAQNILAIPLQPIANQNDRSAENDC